MSSPNAVSSKHQTGTVEGIFHFLGDPYISTIRFTRLVMCWHTATRAHARRFDAEFSWRQNVKNVLTANFRRGGIGTYHFQSFPLPTVAKQNDQSATMPSNSAMRKRSLFVAAAAVAVVSSPSTAAFSTGGSGSHQNSRNSAINVPHHPGGTISAAAAISLTALHGTSSPGAGNGDLIFDQRAFELKNMSRKKFGLKPLSQHEYADLTIQVRAMETEQALKAEELRQSPAAAATSNQAVSSSATARQQQQQKENIFATMAKSLLGESTCESNYDCARPQVCCDLGFKKMCCSSGKGIFEPQAKMELIPVPAAVRRDQ